MKKLIAMLLCLVMIVGLFAACSTSGDEGTKGTDGKDETTVAPDYDTNLMTLYFEEKTGLNLEFQLFSAEYKAEINAKIAANEPLPDILWYMGLGTDLVSTLGNDGYLLDLWPYMEEQAHWYWEAYDKVCEQYGEAQTKLEMISAGIDPISGAFYGVGGYNPAESGDRCISIYINQAWLDKLKLDYPTNVEQLYNVLVAFRDQDPNGNGIPDEIPCIFNGGKPYRSDLTEYIINAFVFCNDSAWFNATDGKVWSAYTTDEYREAMKYLNKLYEEKLFSDSSWSTDRNTLKGLLSPADGINIIGVFGGHTTQSWDVSYDSILEYEFLKPMADETGKGGYAPYDPVFASFYTHVTSSAKDPVMAFRFIDYLLSEEASITQRYGIVGKNWDYCGDGYTTSLDRPAYIKIIDDPWSKLSDDVWHGGGVRISYGQVNVAFDASTASKNSAHRVQDTVDMVNSYLEIGQPDEVIGTLVYNEEEKEVINEYKTTVETLVQQWRAEFISGAKDPNKDSDWQAYLNALKADGLDDVLEAAQSAYTRMLG